MTAREGTSTLVKMAPSTGRSWIRSATSRPFLWQVETSVIPTPSGASQSPAGFRVPGTLNAACPGRLLRGIMGAERCTTNLLSDGASARPSSQGSLVEMVSVMEPSWFAMHIRGVRGTFRQVRQN